MSLFLKPHLGRVFRSVAIETGNRIIGYEQVLVGEFGGQLSRKTPKKFSQEFGIESVNPAVWLMDLVADVYAGDRVEVGMDKYRVVADGLVRDAEEVTSHLLVLLERIGE